MERILSILVDRLVQAFGDTLVSVILYGSAAAGDHDGRYSDLNVLCVLTRLTPEELGKCGPVFHWWRELGNPAPLLMTEQEASASADSFPIEFVDMQENRKILHGKDIVAGLVVDPRYHRAQLEHELRSKLLRLRQQAATVLDDRDRLLSLCLDSVSTFCVLGRHALLLSGRRVAFDKRSTVRGLTDLLGHDLEPFEVLLDIRAGQTAPQEPDPVTLFRKYLFSIERLIDCVDRS